MKKYLNLFIAFILILNLGFLCKDDPVTPVDPPSTGSIGGKIISLNPNTSLSSVNVSTVPPTGFVSTDNNGDFLISNVDSGTYAVTAGKLGYDTVTVNVTVAAGFNSKADIILKPADTINTGAYGRISGTILDSETDIPIKNVHIKTDPTTSSIISDIYGQYLISNVSPGEYKVSAIKTNYDTLTISVKVIAGVNSNADFILEKTDTTAQGTVGTIEGKIIDAITGANIPGVGISTNPPLSSVSSDTAGKYKITNVTPGTYTIRVTKPGYADQTTEVSVTAGNITSADFVLLGEKGSVWGTVTDGTLGSPVTGVSITTNPGTSAVTTDSFGKYQLNDMDPALYAINASKNGYETKVVSVNVLEGRITIVDIVIISQ